MGFRSTITTEHFGHTVPDWFVEKWPWLQFGTSHDGNNTTPKLLITSRREAKFYSEFRNEELLKDVQKVLKEVDVKKLVAVLLHECGGVTRIEITQNDIRGSEPTGWREVEGVTHDYCYDCSDLPPRT